MDRWILVLAVLTLAGACSTSGETTTTTTLPPPTVPTTARLPGTTSSTNMLAPATGVPKPPASTTTPTVADIAPPRIEITSPAEDARVTSNPIRFRGTIEPGCTLIAAGHYPVEIAPNGVWSISLFLNPGSNVAVFDAYDAAGNRTTAQRRVFYETPSPRPDYLRWDDTGVYRVEDGSEVRLISGAVRQSADDLMGGLVFNDLDGPGGAGLSWLPLGYTHPTPLVNGDTSFFTGAFGRRPTLFRYNAAEQCEGYGLVRHDLLTGRDTQTICGLGEGDGGFWIQSIGGDRFVGVSWVAVGPGGTNHAIHFYAADGEEVHPTNNPFPESCAPCELDAFLSPDGSLLAYRHRPDNKWPDTEEPTDEWWARSRLIPADVIVMDMGTGRDLWRIEVPADTSLSDFDGRFVVTERAGESTVHDTFGDVGAFRVAGQVALRREPLAAPADIEAHVVWNNAGYYPDRRADFVPGTTGATLATSSGAAGLAMIVSRGEVATGGWLTELWTSADGYDWTIVDLPAALRRRNVTAVGRTSFGYLVGTGRGPGRVTEVWSSPDGHEWTPTVIDDEEHRAFSRIERIVPGPGGAVIHLLAQDAPGTGAYEELIFTGDGVSYERVMANYGAPGAPNWATLTAQPGRYVVITQQGSLAAPVVEQAIVMSNDGRSWTTATQQPFGPSLPSVIGAAASERGVVVVARGPERPLLFHSGDLTVWHTVNPTTMDDTSAWPTLAGGAAGFVLGLASDVQGQAWFAPDGDRWSRIDLPPAASGVGADDRLMVGTEALIIADDFFAAGEAPEVWVGHPIGYG